MLEVAVMREIGVRKCFHGVIRGLMLPTRGGQPVGCHALFACAANLVRIGPCAEEQAVLARYEGKGAGGLRGDVSPFL